MITRMKSNMRRKHKTSQFQKHKKTKNFQNHKRKKNDKNKKNEKSSSRRRRDDRKNNSIKSNDKKFESSNVICFICDKKKHISSNCFDKNKKKTSVNVVKNDKTKKKIFSNISSIEKNENEKRFMNDENITKMTIMLNVLRSLKTFFNVIVADKMHLSKKQNTTSIVNAVVQLNEKTKCNIIKKQFAVINEMKKISNELSLFFYINDFIFYCYETCKIRYKFIDD